MNTTESIITRFFVPTDAFWRWLAFEATARTVVDIGCGRGDLVRECAGYGINAMGIDPWYQWSGETVPTDLTNQLMPMEVTDCMDIITAPNMLLLCCRPCHDGFPVDVAEADRTSPFFYVGFEKNLLRDIGVSRVELVRVDGQALVAGKEGEMVWRVLARHTLREMAHHTAKDTKPDRPWAVTMDDLASPTAAMYSALSGLLEAFDGKGNPVRLNPPYLQAKVSAARSALAGAKRALGLS